LAVNGSLKDVRGGHNCGGGGCFFNEVAACFAGAYCLVLFGIHNIFWFLLLGNNEQG
jgi:hypothetical protein